eukprot:SAG31_NODE_4976_length_2823_cov_1.737885_3_plen_164_part_00
MLLLGAAMVVFKYEGVWLGFANVFNPESYYNGQGMPPYDSVGATPVGTVNTVLTWSPDARNWRYIQPTTSFIPRGSPVAGDFDCCGIFMAKQNPTLTPSWTSGEETLPLFCEPQPGCLSFCRASSDCLPTGPTGQMLGVMEHSSDRERARLGACQSSATALLG